MTVLQLKLSANLYIKDPQSTVLGRRIIDSSIKMIAEVGFEAFTFKKLSLAIESTEASVYRYFENKHRLLTYLIAWYWAWTEYRISFETHNIPDAQQKLDKALSILTEKKTQDDNFPDVDEPSLQKIVIAESDKTYLTHKVDEDNKEGLFKGYKSLCNCISNLIIEINPDFPFPHALISTALEAANQQIFFATHLPALTELSTASDPFEANYVFLKSLVFNTIRAKQ